MSLNATLSNLRALAHAEPSGFAWRRICDAVDAITQTDALTLAIDYLNTHLNAWPDALRLPPPNWYQHHIIEWRDEPRWALVRALELELVDQRPQSLVQRLVDTGALASITWLQLRYRRARTIADPAHRLQGSDMAYLAAHPLSQQLRHLDLRGHTIGAEGMRYLVLSPVLTQLDHLNLDQNEVGDEGIQSLMASPRPAQMRVLSLNACTISDAGAKLLAQGDWPCLERLELKLNTVGQEGALALAEAPGLSPSLRRIWRQHAAAQPLTLELEPGGRRYTVLPGESVQIGRTADNDLVLGYPTVPRQQCTLSVTQEAAHLRDTRSASGTYINGVAQHDKALRIDDHIQLGPVTARVMSVP